MMHNSGVTIATDSEGADRNRGLLPAPELPDVVGRVGRAWREIRRGASANEIKSLFYGSDGDPDALDMALADALTVLVQQGPLRMGELAEALHITPASTTRAVSCLVDRGYAVRKKSDRDQRSFVAYATEEGVRVHRVFYQRIQDGIGEILSRFSDEEQDVLSDLLERFASSVDQYVVDSSRAAETTGA